MVILVLLIIGIIVVCENLIFKVIFFLNWGSLLGWSLFCVSFVVLVVLFVIEVFNLVFVVWICILVIVWIIDYVLKSIEEVYE